MVLGPIKGTSLREIASFDLYAVRRNRCDGLGGRCSQEPIPTKNSQVNFGRKVTHAQKRNSLSDLSEILRNDLWGGSNFAILPIQLSSSLQILHHYTVHGEC